MKGNPYHDELGQFTDADHAVEPGTHRHLKPDRGVQIAEDEHPTTMSDVRGGGGSSAPASNPDIVLGAHLATQLATEHTTKPGVQLVVQSERQRLSYSNPPPDQPEWLQMLGLTDGKSMLQYMVVAATSDTLLAGALKGQPTQEIIDAAEKYGAQYNISPQTLLDIIAFETGGSFDPNSHNRSGASGLFQIMPRTWESLADDNWNTFNVDQNVQVGAMNLQSTANRLVDLGIADPTEDQLYFAHQQGADGAAALLNNPDMLAVDALQTINAYANNSGKAALAITQNGGNVGMTSQQSFCVHVTTL